jgi:hypothetical protein
MSNGWQSTYIHTCTLHAPCCTSRRSCLAVHQVAERTSSCCPTDTFLATGAEESACIRRHVSARGWGEGVGGGPLSPPTLRRTASRMRAWDLRSHVILGYARWCDRMIFVFVCLMMGLFFGHVGNLERGMIYVGSKVQECICSLAVV